MEILCRLLSAFLFRQMEFSVKLIRNIVFIRCIRKKNSSKLIFKFKNNSSCSETWGDESVIVKSEKLHSTIQQTTQLFWKCLQEKSCTKHWLKFCCQSVPETWYCSRCAKKMVQHKKLRNALVRK